MGYKCKLTWYDGEATRHGIDGGACREVGIMRIKRMGLCPTSTKITITFYGKINPIIQDICGHLEVDLAPVKADGLSDLFKISGNDKHILPAWYWIIAALRSEEQHTTLLKLLEATLESRMCEQSSIFGYYVDKSLNYWSRFLETGKTHTTYDMLLRCKCLLDLEEDRSP